MSEQSSSAPTLVIFGASGDLTSRKLMPAIYHLYRKKRIPEGTHIVGFSRSQFSHDAFRDHLGEKIREFSKDYDADAWAALAANVYYVAGQPDNLEDFKKLSTLLDEVEGEQPAGRLYYMATPPSLFTKIVTMLGKCEMQLETKAWRRLIVEKPFGHDLESAHELNAIIHSAFNEHQIYRIDHYLGKETVQNVTVFRFANAIFEPIWNRTYIDNIQISVLETVKVGRRAGYYDTAGVMRDMFQNHLYQLLALIAMEPPASFDADALRNEKVKVLSSMSPLESQDLSDIISYAQYRSYRDEPDVKPKSKTPTFAALKLYIDNWRWQGVPFYLRSGKALAEKKTRIVVQFKSPPHLMFGKNKQELKPNILAIDIQPKESIHLSFQAKVPAVGIEMQEVNFDFAYAEAFKDEAIPEAYERLLLDALQGDAALFIRSDEVELSWTQLDPIIRSLEGDNGPLLEFYEEGSYGPAGADRLLKRDGFHWML